MNTIQFFEDEYLEHCKSLSPTAIAKFLEDYRLLHGQKIGKSKSKLISMKVPEDLLAVFRQKCELESLPYQTMIKKLMLEWLS